MKKTFGLTWMGMRRKPWKLMLPHSGRIYREARNSTNAVLF
jgi:hypothetical protein